MKIVTYAIALTLTIGLLSCASTLQASEEEPTVLEAPQLLFLNYEMKTYGNKKSISLINQVTTDGRLKQHINHNPNPDLGDLECVILDKDSNILETYSIKNPLLKIVEYINDSGHFEKKILNLDYAQFSLKLQLNAKAAYAVIHEINPNGNIKLKTTKIE
ncbi:DEAD/DEAH box helicase family protein [Winogradskyella sediminis]|uniref:hypothetical protein n=1 Tax=Winogradskyella sediminis TaxID=1382466 RepID=UPI000E254DCA|nr:hypothetical protein [Winogradskyella sediminis]REG85192.1 hypothetical protein C8N41_10452 [Winogradskyella sediminis]